MMQNWLIWLFSLDYIIPRPLSDINVMWQWEGKGVMSMGYGDLEETFRWACSRLIDCVKVIDEFTDLFLRKNLKSLIDAIFLT